MDTHEGDEDAREQDLSDEASLLPTHPYEFLKPTTSHRRHEDSPLDELIQQLGNETGESRR